MQWRRCSKARTIGELITISIIHRCKSVAACSMNLVGVPRVLPWNSNRLHGNVPGTAQQNRSHQLLAKLIAVL